MILYTMMPEELIFPSSDVEEKSVTYGGVQMMVRGSGINEYEIVRLISSDPNDYLQYTPGTKISTALHFTF